MLPGRWVELGAFCAEISWGDLWLSTSVLAPNAKELYEFLRTMRSMSHSCYFVPRTGVGAQRTAGTGHSDQERAN